MKLTRAVLGLLLAACLVGGMAGGYFWGSRASAQAPEPGTEQDPLVTKSYVDEAVKPINLEVVELARGKQLVAEAGTEIIVRAGRASVVPGSLGGLADVTVGKDLTSGDAPLNHLLVVPRSEGRGVKAVTDCVVLVRGGYTIK